MQSYYETIKSIEEAAPEKITQYECPQGMDGHLENVRFFAAFEERFG